MLSIAIKSTFLPALAVDIKLKNYILFEKYYI